MYERERRWKNIDICSREGYSEYNSGYETKDLGWGWEAQRK